MEPVPFFDFVDLTGDSDEDEEARNCAAPAASDGDQRVKAPDEITADATIVHSCVSPVHGTKSRDARKKRVKNAFSLHRVQQRVIWSRPIRGRRLEHVATGGWVDSLRLVILPLENGNDFPGEVRDSLWRHSNEFPAVAALGESTNPIPNFPIQPAESHSSRSTPAPPGPISASGLPLSTDPAAGPARVSVGRVVLPPGDYSSPGWCRATWLSLKVARRALEVRASELDRFGRCVFPLQQNQDSSQFVGDIDLPGDCDYDCVEDCRLVALWFELTESMMKEREDTLSRGDSVPPVGNTGDIDLGVEEQVFGELEPQTGKKRKGEQGPVQSRKRRRHSN
ncbi:hypothetical protein ACJ73_07436 [Blastomyces percursus]|uniref:Uncharacterized protein n=1 Tax=Blastomyces percursus TaxID=1658174 RepID=A0A1J9PZA2_9EURO|nr:hypothetical protein ACJ73_07436 [Blastomyces percursus]